MARGVAYPHVVWALRRYGRGRVLDVGCGSGQYRPYVVGQYVGLEPGTAYAGRRDVVAVGEAIPFVDSTFDCVLMVGILLVIDDPLRTIREAVRALKPDGHLLMFEYRPEVVRRLATADPRHRHALSAEAYRSLLRTAGLHPFTLPGLPAGRLACLFGAPLVGKIAGRTGIWICLGGTKGRERME